MITKSFHNIILLCCFSVRFFHLPGNGAAALAIIFFLLGLTFLGMYVLLLKLAKKLKSEMPRYRDQIIVVTIVAVSVLLSGHGEWVLVLGMFAVFAFTTQRLWSRPKTFWRLWFFRAARDYFREIKSYTNRPNKRMQSDRPTAGR